jgi:hypothetical protein
MTGKCKIQFTDATWNPLAGCSIVSPGCTNCYAMRQAARIERMGGADHYVGLTEMVNGKPVWTGKVALASERTLLAPLRWKKPRKIFVNSMSDLFHESVPDEWIDRIFAVMALCPQHTFQVLTKRSKRMREYLLTPWTRVNIGDRVGNISADGDNDHDAFIDGPWPLPNVWLCVTAEDQTRADERIPDLKDKRSTAQAMAEAIDDDDAGKQAVARFVETRDFPPEGIKASLLYGDFVTWAERENVAPMSVIAFSKALEANGIEKKRTKAGIHYLGLKSQAEAAQ